MRKIEQLRTVTKELVAESDEFMKNTLNLVPTMEVLQGLDPETFGVLQKSMKLIESSKLVTEAQLDYYESVESKLDEILAELKELKQLQATNKVAKEK